MKQATVIQGMMCFGAGIRALLFEAELRAIFLRMVAVLLLLMVLCASTVFMLSGIAIVHYVPEVDAWYGEVLRVAAWLLAVLLSLIVGMVAYVALASIVLSPWLDELAARAESPPQTPATVVWWRSVGQSIVHAIMPLTVLLPFAAAALPCLLIPVIGVPVATALWAYGGMRFLSYELLDVPASRRTMDWSQRREHIARQQGFYLGLTVSASLMLMLPLLNVLVVPAAVVGLSRRMERVGE